MKKKYLLSSLSLILLSQFLNTSALAESSKNKALIKKIKNKVEYKYEDVLWHQAEVNQEIFPITSIRTGENSKSDILFPDGTVTRMGSNAFFTFIKKQNRAVKIHLGKVWFDVKKKSEGLEIYTPNAVAIITGTEGFVDFTTDKLLDDNKYIVKKGDTVKSIAKKISGKPFGKEFNELSKKIRELNPKKITKNNFLIEGDTIYLNEIKEVPVKSKNSNNENYFALGLIEGSSNVFKADKNGNPTGDVQKVKEGEMLVLQGGKFSIKDVYDTLIPPENMVVVRGGNFQIGSENGESDEKSVKKVNIRSFYIGKHEVTQSEYESVIGKNPSKFKGNNLPVEEVSWWDAIRYCNQKSIKENLPVAYDENTGELLDSEGQKTRDVTQVIGYRLPTEAEWEYAAKGANNQDNFLYSGSNNLDEVSWFGYKLSDYKTHSIESKKPNKIGLYDMSGNVSEWVYDVYASNGYEKIGNNNPYLSFGGENIFRVYRGGSWDQIEKYHTVFSRSGYKPDFKNENIGFRIAKNITF